MPSACKGSGKCGESSFQDDRQKKLTTGGGRGIMSLQAVKRKRRAKNRSRRERVPQAESPSECSARYSPVSRPAEQNFKWSRCPRYRQTRRAFAREDRWYRAPSPYAVAWGAFFMGDYGAVAENTLASLCEGGVPQWRRTRLPPSVREVPRSGRERACLPL